MTNSTVRAHTFGLDTSVESTWWVNHSPAAGGDGGCSSKPSGGAIHDTAGSVSLATSRAKSVGKTEPNAFLCNVVAGSLNREKYNMMLSDIAIEIGLLGW